MSDALLVIDAQKVYTDPESELYCTDNEATIRNINHLIKHFEGRKSPIIFVRHVHKADGSDIGHLFDATGEQAEDFNFKLEFCKLRLTVVWQRHGRSSFNSP